MLEKEINAIMQSCHENNLFDFTLKDNFLILTVIWNLNNQYFLKTFC